MTKTLIFADAHLETGQIKDRAYLMLKNVIRKEKFDSIIILGDFLDMSYISQWNKEKPGLTEGKRLKNDIDLLENEIKFMKRYTKDIIFYEGNHEFRLQNFIYENPVLDGLISIKSVCDKLGVQYVPTDKQPVKYLKDLYLAHGLALNKYCATKNVETAKESILTGHTHRTQVYTTSGVDEVPLTGYSIGCISSIHPDYVKGKRITGWSQSFGILWIDRQQWQVDLIMVKRNKCIIGGKIYKGYKD